MVKCYRCGNNDIRFFGIRSDGLYCRKCVSFQGEELEGFLCEPSQYEYDLTYKLSKEQLIISKKVLLSVKRKKDVLIALNDGPGDGIDVSWIWDVDFEKLSEANLASLTASGIRKDDLALRLKYAGFENVIVKENNKQSLSEVVSGKGDVSYILVNYTAMFGTQTNLKALEENK